MEGEGEKAKEDKKGAEVRKKGSWRRRQEGFYSRKTRGFPEKEVPASID